MNKKLFFNKSVRIGKIIISILSVILVSILLCSCEKAPLFYRESKVKDKFEVEQADNKTTKEFLNGLKDVDTSIFIANSFKLREELQENLEFSFEAEDLKADCRVKWYAGNNASQVKNGYQGTYREVKINGLGMGYQPVWLIYPEEKYDKNSNYPYRFNMFFTITRKCRGSCCVEANISLDNKNSKHFEELSRYIAEKVNESINEKYQKLLEENPQARTFYGQ